MKTCKHCGREFGGINKSFCCKACSSVYCALRNHREGLVNKKWLPDRVCKWCGKKYPRKNKSLKFCSQRCYGDSKKGVKSGPHRPETVAKIKAKAVGRQGARAGRLQCKECGKSLNGKPRRQLYCSGNCSGKGKWKSAEYRSKVRVSMAANHAGWSMRAKGRESFPEKFWREGIQARTKASFVQEHVMKKKFLGVAGNSNYFLDFFFPEMRLNLEIDGRQHDERQESDTVRDRALAAAGITVVRYRWPTGKDRIVMAYAQIDEFVANFVGP